MTIKLEFAIYDDTLDAFSLDETIYTYELNEDQAKTYELFKSEELHLYNWFTESQSFQTWLKEEVYVDKDISKVAICDIDEISFRRFYFFKVTSGDVHYEYFKELFEIFHETDWQDREEVGEKILLELQTKRQEFIIDLSEKNVDAESEELEEIE